MADGSGAWVESHVGGVELSVHDLSARGAGLRLIEGSLEEAMRSELTLRLEGHPEFSARLEPIRGPDRSRGQPTLGVQLEALDRDALGLLCRVVTELFVERTRPVGRLETSSALTLEIRDEALLKRLLRARLIHDGSILRAYLPGTSTPVLVRALALDFGDGGGLQGEILGGPSHLLASSTPAVFTFPGYNSISVFRSSIARRSGSRAVIDIPVEIVQTGFRCSPRARLSSRELNVSFEHPLLPGAFLDKRVLDVGTAGFSVPFSPSADILFPGQKLGSVCLELPQGPVRARAALRGVDCGGSEAPAVMGVELLGFDDRRDARRWKDFVFRELHRWMEVGTPRDVADYWTALDRSGYLKLIPESRLPTVRKHFFQTWSEGSFRGGKGLQFLLARDNARTVGSVATSIYYPRTWLVHHLGVDEAQRRDRQFFFELMSEIASGVVYMLYHLVPLEYYLMIFNAERAWSDMLYLSFLKLLPGHEDYILDLCALHKYSVDPVSRVLGLDDETFRIVVQDRRLDEALSGHLRASVTPLEFDAMSYGARDISLEGFTRSCKALGLERTRTIYFALRGDEPIAALIAETGEVGANVFGLYNRCWAVFLAGDQRDRDAALRLLLARVVQHYRERSKQAFYFFDKPAAHEALLSQLGFSYVENVYRYIGRRSLLPAWLTYLRQTFDSMRVQATRASTAA